ncbi:MAG: recombinase A [Vicinamibacteraceae bacterium]
MSTSLPQPAVPARVPSTASSSRLPAFHAGAAAPAPGAPIWNLFDLSGRLVELSADAEAAPLTAAFGLVLDAQLAGDRAAWVMLTHSSFFPPDVVDGGVDLDALVVVRVPTARLAGRAADTLVSSGGFGLVVIDLSSQPATDGLLPTPLLVRLLGRARQQDVAVLLLTKKSSAMPSLDSLISLRAEARWRVREERYELSVHVLKDKRRGPGWTHVEACRGPAGLR